jgi:hypothetical protein
MQNNILTIEDCIEAITDAVNVPSTFEIDTPDQILMSLARQIRRGLALTDRQIIMAREKVLKYKSVFEDNDIYNLEDIVEKTRHPVRLVDRTKTISIVKFKSRYDSSNPRDYIKIRFPFNKKAMQQINDLTSVLVNRSAEYFHEKGTHEHYIKLTELTIEKVVEIFSKKNFYIDPTLLEMYNEIISIKDNPEQFLPGMFKDSIRNIPSNAIDMLINEIGQPSFKNRLLYRDRSIRYGISYYDFEIPGHSVTEKIALRKAPEVLVSPDVEFSNVIESIIDLKRNPVLVLINDIGKASEVLSETRIFYDEFSKYFSNTEQSVLFRIDNVPNTYTVNDFIKEKSLNNWVDENTKVVYIMKSRLPNLLVTGSWKPITSVSLTSDTSNTMVKEYIKHHCDLILYRDSYISNISKIYQKEKIDVIY